MENNASQNMPSKKGFSSTLLLTCVIAVYVIFAALSFNPALTYYGDDHAYTLLARSISQGKGYVEISHPEQRPHLQYPPGYPSALAAISRVTGENIIAYKAFSFFCSILALIILFAIFSKKTDPLYLAIILTASSLNPVFLEFSSSVLSEMMFMMVFFLSLWIMTLKPESVQTGKFIIGVIIFALTFYIRSAAVFLFAGMGLYLLYKKAWVRTVLFGIICALVLFPWALRNMKADKSGGVYVGSALMSRNFYDWDKGKASPPELAGRWVKNAIYVAAVEMPGAFVPQISTVARKGLNDYIREKGIRLRDIPSSLAKSPSLKVMACIAIIILISPIVIFILIKGFIADFRAGPDCLHFITVVYGGLVLLWPSVWIHFRLFMPVSIFLWVFFAKGLPGAGKSGKALAVVGVLLALTALNNIPTAAANARMNIHDIKAGEARSGPPEDMEDYVAALNWINANVPDEAFVISRKPNVTYFITGNRSDRYPYTRDAETMRRFILDGGYEYVLLDVSGEAIDFLKPFIEKTPDAFSLLYVSESGKCSVFKVKANAIAVGGK